MNEVLREFLLETHENLAQIDNDLLTLEKNPTEREALARVFRAVHSTKGTAGFIGLVKLQAIAHAGESLLSHLRAGKVTFNRPIATGLLTMIDAHRQVLANLETTGAEGDGDFSALIARLDHLRETGGADEVGDIPTPTPPPTDQPLQSSATLKIVAKPESAPTVVVVSTPPEKKLTPEPVVPEPPPADAEAKTAAVSDSSIRVDVGLLDTLMTLVGELVLARNQIMQFSASQEDGAFLGTVQRLNLLTTELQEGVMKTRMQPIGNVWAKFPRVVRDLAVACGKQVRFEMDGRETELDKTIIEAIRDPLTHMVRNAVDHGIEPPADRVAAGKSPEGRLTLHAAHEGGKVIIELADDGGGIDPQRVRAKAIAAKVVTAAEAAKLSDRELVNLVFLPGFSTADKVTHFSGRGVGMDVVRTNIEKIGGVVDIESRVGLGTTVTMKIPLTLAIIPALTVTSAGDRYAIPQVSLLELVRLDAEQAHARVEHIHGQPVYRLRGTLLPLVYLDKHLHGDAAPAHAGDVNIVVLQADDRQFGLVVDAVHDTEEIVVKPLQKQLKGVSAYAGATIMGDGRVALILDVVGLAQGANVLAGPRGRGHADRAAYVAAATRDSHLVFAPTGGGRMAIPLSLVSRLEEFPRTMLEQTGPRDVVQYRGEILPLTDVSRELGKLAGSTTAPHAPASDTVPVVVCHGATGPVGLVVGAILDIADEEVAGRAKASRPGVLFTGIVQGRVTEFLDVGAVTG
jgi:two-component system chemotaxis sensor kinase CheA